MFFLVLMLFIVLCIVATVVVGFMAFLPMLIEAFLLAALLTGICVIFKKIIHRKK